MGRILSHLILVLSAGHRHVTWENHSIQTTIHLWTSVTVEQLRGLHGRVHLMVGTGLAIIKNQYMSWAIFPNLTCISFSVL